MMTSQASTATKMLSVWAGTLQTERAKHFLCRCKWRTAMGVTAPSSPLHQTGSGRQQQTQTQSGSYTAHVYKSLLCIGVGICPCIYFHMHARTLVFLFFSILLHWVFFLKVAPYYYMQMHNTPARARNCRMCIPRYSHLYHGEQYDGTVVDDATKWQPATPSMFDTGLGTKGGSSMVPASKALGAPALLTMPPLEVSKSYTPLSVNKVGLSSKSATAAAPPLTFIRCLGADSYCGHSIFFVDAKNQTRHHVTACNQYVRLMTPTDFYLEAGSACSFCFPPGGLLA